MDLRGAVHWLRYLRQGEACAKMQLESRAHVAADAEGKAKQGNKLKDFKEGK